MALIALSFMYFLADDNGNWALFHPMFSRAREKRLLWVGSLVWLVALWAYSWWVCWCKHFCQVGLNLNIPIMKRLISGRDHARFRACAGGGSGRRESPAGQNGQWGYSTTTRYITSINTESKRGLESYCGLMLPFDILISSCSHVDI